MSSPLVKPPLTIISVSAEVAPWSKVGGLAEVAAALPIALARRGHRVIGVAPGYHMGESALPLSAAADATAQFDLFGDQHQVGYRCAQVDGVQRVFIDHPALGRGGVYGDAQGLFGDNLLRFTLLSRAALDAPRALGLDLGEQGADTVFLAHDWHAALVPVYLSAHYRCRGAMVRARSLLTIHNLAYQGQAARSVFADLGLDPRWLQTLEMGQDINLLKAGIVAADRVNTVSARYAQDICTVEAGCGLDGVLRMRGPVVDAITNGLDTDAWDPSTDAMLPARYTADDLAGKAACKAALQAELGLAVDPGVPLVGFIGRLDWQKGVDLLLQAVPALARMGAQLVVLGSGDPGLEQALRAATSPTVRPWIGFSARLAHVVTAACDLMVVPSRFEPCGLTQVQAMRYGTVPVVAATGGLIDTVAPFDPLSAVPGPALAAGPDGRSAPPRSAGSGWLFQPGSADDLVLALGNAIHVWRDWPDSFQAIMRRGMQADWSWDRPAAAYEELMRRALASNPWA